MADLIHALQQQMAAALAAAVARGLVFAPGQQGPLMITVEASFVVMPQPRIYCRLMSRSLN